MYEIIKHAEEFELNRVKANAEEFINLIEELRLKKQEQERNIPYQRQSLGV